MVPERGTEEVGAACPRPAVGWIEGRAPHLGRLLIVRRWALIDAGRTALSVLVVRRREMKLMTATATPTLSVLLVEDEVMIRMMIAEMLEELGHRVAAETGEIDQAIRLAQNTEFDLAILDVNVQGKLITPVAELITALNRPIIFATGYGAAGIPEEFRGRPSLEKPFLVETLARTIDLTLRSHRSENEAP